MNLPNKLTVFRVILVPFCVFFLLLPGIPNHFLWALIIFCLAAYTDHLDGMLARKNNQITNFGKFMDPLADKIMVVSALVCLVSLGLADTWCVILIIAREFIVTSVRLAAVDNGVVVAANNWGKAKTVSQILAIFVILALQYVLELVAQGKLALFTIAGVPAEVVFGQIGFLLILVATFFAIFSGFIYVKQNINVISTTK
jgi:CDP-diacylglycerol--glycerol-3-phosphate 3-phosphatidyltransferase